MIVSVHGMASAHAASGGGQYRHVARRAGNVTYISLHLLVFVLASCAHQKVAPPAEVPLNSGRVSGEVLLDPAAPATEASEREVFETPRQHAGNAMPEYPTELMQSGLPAQAVAVRIVVDGKGQVARVEPLPAAAGDAVADPRFLHAVRLAVMGWRFEPFQVIHWVPGPDLDGDGEADSETVGSEENRPFRFDMRFRFEVLDGKAKVSS